MKLKIRVLWWRLQRRFLMQSRCSLSFGGEQPRKTTDHGGTKDTKIVQRRRPFRTTPARNLALALVAVGMFLIAPAVENFGQSKRTPKPGVEAAARNATLSQQLPWTFGNKQQRGWYIYTPLIKRLIDTKNESASPQFALAVGLWQAKSGLTASGVLDAETLYAMIKHWQDARLKDRTVATPDQLITAPISDFYDPTRAEELRQVERRTYQAYKRMVAAAVADRSLGLAHTRGPLAPEEKCLKII